MTHQMAVNCIQIDEITEIWSKAEFKMCLKLFAQFSLNGCT